MSLFLLFLSIKRVLNLSINVIESNVLRGKLFVVIFNLNQHEIKKKQIKRTLEKTLISLSSSEKRKEIFSE